jgi:hypothetical protein
MVPLMRPLDAILPTPPLSLIAILRPAPAADAAPGHERPSPDSVETRPPAETGRQAASVSGLR